MFSIGEFSKATGLTVKTLRFYHEQGILVPSHVDGDNGYRFYAEAKIDTARVIARLRELEFSIAEISEIVGNYDDDGTILAFLESRKTTIQDRMRADRQLVLRLEQIIHQEHEANATMSDSNFSVEKKTLDTVLVAGVRMKGKYCECGSGFATIGRKFGRHVCGKPMLLCYDTEYRAEDADFEAAMPIRKGESTESIKVHELPAGRCLSLMHLGPYERLSRSYEKILRHAKENGMELQCPSREVYHKGPGMIFRGNPKKYLTEIQFLLKD
ncbi:MerR family transcriptional regulator [Novipirellula artificiosorum]|uniref:Mercuric resistance operon regulatory protein n=1 Tax=Novipirellula artificiosorum TaxID=2528016 RepID=A0A5C6E1X2_9BACT|nr:MerR family transcriptional regulator [Novipirellula artificiosorum]TWU42900.1 Mercuric resistance operon regulatory protein [Novipirellula artificiosorum]